MEAAQNLEETQDAKGFMYALIYVRSFLATILFFPHTFLCCVPNIIFGALGMMSICNWAVHMWGAGAMRLYGVRIKQYNRTNVRPEGGVLLLFNHQSDFDIFALHDLFNNKFRFGAKIELFKIPVFGWAMRNAGVLPIPRQNRSEAFKVYREAEGRFADGWVFALAPEGTRMREPVIGKFKRGPFIFAVNAKAPIVPVVIKGAYEVLSKDRRVGNVGRWTRTIHVEFLPEIRTENRTLEEVDALTEDVRNQMVAAYERLPNWT